MEKKELKEKLDSKIKELKTACNYSKKADTLIDEVLSLKGQYDVKERVVVSQIKASAYSITLYDNEDIEFHINGLTTTLKSQIHAYHFPFNALLNLHDNYDKLDQEAKDNYETLLSNVCIIMQMPTIVFTTPNLYQKVIIPYIDYLNEQFEKAQKIENLPKDNDAKNEAFKQEEELNEQLKEDFKKEGC